MNTESDTQVIATPGPKEENFFIELIKFIIIAALIIIPFRVYVAEPYIVSGASMSPTFESGNYLIIDKLSHRIDTVDRGSVIVFKYPNDESQFYVKRVIALPGETIKIQNSKVFIKKIGSDNFVQIDEPYVKNTNQRDTETTLTSTQYYVMGDNRGNSSDSRAWGPLETELLKGEAVARLFPFNQIDITPGKATPEFITNNQ